jgi:hypothetical protein
MGCILLAHDRDQWRILVEAVMKLLLKFHKMLGISTVVEQLVTCQGLSSMELS